jgi:hypothetical protein
MSALKLPLILTPTNTYRYAYEMLINRVPALISSPLGVGINKTGPSAALDEANYPNISFWTQVDGT